MEASALQAPAGLSQSRIRVGVPLLRLRSDEQLVTLFRAGDEEAFRVIHDRYRQRLLAYTRQMLSSRQDAEDALQDVFVRAYAALRSNERELALRAWLYRIAHNRCIDELRRPAALSGDGLEMLARSPMPDPIAQAEQRESLRRLIADVRRLPEQQRSALLMRELTGMSYAELSGALEVSVPAVKSLLVRARVSLTQAARARDTACAEIREELILAHDRGRRPAAMARRHLRDCAGCREFRSDVRGVSRQIAALVPAVGPAGVVANLLGFGGSAGSGAAAGGGSCATAALTSGAGHVATLLAAAAVTAGGAVEIQHTLASPAPHRAHAAAVVRPAAAPATPAPPSSGTPPIVKTVGPAAGGGASATAGAPFSALPAPHRRLPASTATPAAPGPASTSTNDPGSTPISSAALDPSMGPGPFMGNDGAGSSSSTGTGDQAAGGTSTSATSGSGSDSGTNLLSQTSGSGSDQIGGGSAATAVTAGDGAAGAGGGSTTSASGGASTTSSRPSTSTSRS